MAKNIVLVILHILHCEKFYITVEEAETACIQLMKNINCSSKLNMNISRNYTAAYKKIAVNLYFLVCIVVASMTVRFLCHQGIILVSITNFAGAATEFGFVSDTGH